MNFQLPSMRNLDLLITNHNMNMNMNMKIEKITKNS